MLRLSKDCAQVVDGAAANPHSCGMSRWQHGKGAEQCKEPQVYRDIPAAQSCTQARFSKLRPCLMALSQAAKPVMLAWQTCPGMVPADTNENNREQRCAASVLEDGRDILMRLTS